MMTYACAGTTLTISAAAGADSGVRQLTIIDEEEIVSEQPLTVDNSVIYIDVLKTVGDDPGPRRIPTT